MKGLTPVQIGLLASRGNALKVSKHPFRAIACVMPPKKTRWRPDTIADTYSKRIYPWVARDLQNYPTIGKNCQRQKESFETGYRDGEWTPRQMQWLEEQLMNYKRWAESRTGLDRACSRKQTRWTDLECVFAIQWPHVQRTLCLGWPGIPTPSYNSMANKR